jgi:hypothetical protein
LGADKHRPGGSRLALCRTFSRIRARQAHARIAESGNTLPQCVEQRRRVFVQSEQEVGAKSPIVDRSDELVFELTNLRRFARSGKILLEAIENNHERNIECFLPGSEGLTERSRIVERVLESCTRYRHTNRFFNAAHQSGQRRFAPSIEQNGNFCVPGARAALEERHDTRFQDSTFIGAGLGIKQSEARQAHEVDEQRDLVFGRVGSENSVRGDAHR